MIHLDNAFDKAYFEDIWGTVHRHDDIAVLAQQMFDRYGKVRYLDIGTGCGWFVKTLNDLGADAVGTEVSEYALQNHHGNVVYGDFRQLPFTDNSFDVVISNGVLEYLPEEDIATAINEAKRVGKYQYHTVDYATGVWYDKYAITNEDSEFWLKYGVKNGFFSSPA